MNPRPAPVLSGAAGPEPASPVEAGSRPAAARDRIDSQALLRGSRMVEIAHEGAVYRLQATRLGKLILTK